MPVTLFYKLFRSFNANIILQTQFYSGYLNLRSFIDLRTVTFLTDLHCYDLTSPASHLFYVCGTSEWTEVANRYNIYPTNSVGHCKAKIWAALEGAIVAFP